MGEGGKSLVNSAPTSLMVPPAQEAAHDWVWLGRATLERTSGALVPAASVNNNSHRHAAMRITANPIDSATYVKDRPRHNWSLWVFYVCESCCELLTNSLWLQEKLQKSSIKSYMYLHKMGFFKVFKIVVAKS